MDTPLNSYHILRNDSLHITRMAVEGDAVYLSDLRIVDGKFSEIPLNKDRVVDLILVWMRDPAIKQAVMSDLMIIDALKSNVAATVWDTLEVKRWT